MNPLPLLLPDPVDQCSSPRIQPSHPHRHTAQVHEDTTAVQRLLSTQHTPTEK